MNEKEKSGKGAGENTPVCPAAPLPLCALSPAQRLVLRGIAQGKKSNEIADSLPEDLRVSTEGVRYHRKEIYRKLGIHCPAEATRIALACGLLET